MKTNKQIALKAMELGKEYYSDSIDMDEIIVYEEDYLRWQEKLQSKISLYNMAPPIKEGVFTFTTEGYCGKLIFDCEIDETEKAIIKLISLYSSNHIEWLWDFQCVFIMDNIFNSKELTNSWLREYSDATIEVMGKQKKSEKQIEEYVERKGLKNAEGPISAFLLTNAWINYLMEHPEEKEIKRRERRTNSDGTKVKSDGTTESATKTNQATKKVINLNRITIRTNDTKTERQLKSRKKSTFSWTVRGHVRHYKSGKIVYIKPYEKGTGNKRKKIYTT